MTPEDRARAALKAAEVKQNLKDGVDPDDLNMFTEEAFFVEEIATAIRAAVEEEQAACLIAAETAARMGIPASEVAARIRARGKA